MGLLDDAIREHLDLKRRRGADPAEVARLEQEALGPVRREPVPAADPEPEPEAAPPHEAVEHEAPHAEVRHDEHAEPAHEADPEPHAHEHAPAPHAAEEAHHHAAEEPHALPPDERHDPPHGDPLNQPTTEYRVEDHHDGERDEHGHAPEAGPREDVLEETPEFLQETPEHDRLWFEQRPPRDFDFDG
jgi:hypothetical protein